jgi:hypothetical protein
VIRLSEVDYSKQDVSIRRAFAEAVQTAGPLPQPLRSPLSLRWGSREIVAGDIFEVPADGRVRLEFLEAGARLPVLRQGADIEVRPGCEVEPGSPVPLLRTWHDPEISAAVEYDYFADDRLMRTSNVYEVLRANRLYAERWTENAGMWIEVRGAYDRIYHCSHGAPGGPARFDALVYRVTILETPRA